MNQVPSIQHSAPNSPQNGPADQYSQAPAAPMPGSGEVSTQRQAPSQNYRKGILSPRIAGISLIVLSFLLMAALASWTVSDPSLSHATPGPVTNWLGTPGAVISDLMMQLLGLGSLLFTLPLAIWGWAFIRRKNLTSFGVRFSCWLGATLFASGILACLAKPESWPLPSNLGGLTGDLFLGIAKLILGANPAGASAVLYGLILTVPTILLGGFALGLIGKSKQFAPAFPDIAPNQQATSDHDVQVHYSQPQQQTAEPAEEPWQNGAQQSLQEPQDDELEGLTSVLLGAVSHSVMSAKATLNRLNIFRRRPQAMPAQAHPADPTYNAYQKIEPTLQAGASHVAPPQAYGAEPVAPNPYAEQQYAPEAAPHAYANHGIPQENFPQEGYPQDHYVQQNDTHQQFAPESYPQEPIAQEPVPQEFYDVPVEPIHEHAFEAPAFSEPVAAPHAPIAENVRVTAPAPRPEPAKRNYTEAQGSLLNFGEFVLPPLHLLEQPPATQLANELSPQVLEQRARQLEGVLEDFGVNGEINDVRPGPVVTLYELEPAPGIRSSRVIGLADDIARSMSAKSARVSVVPGRNAIGIELPNEVRETVYLREMLGSRDFEKVKGKLPVCLGKNIGGEPIIADLARMPHLLIAGTTGSGKSVGINTMILSLLYRHTPEQCRLIMIDPKMLELSVYDGIPHLLTPVVTDPHKAVTALKWAVREMEDRYKKMSKIGVRNIDGFNARVKSAADKGETITRTVQTGFNKETGEAILESETFELEHLPYIVVIVDEMADLMMVAGKDIEGAIQRLAQMARAAGIHMITATQRPSVDVITGTIKANFPTRISFQVTSKIDSRTILGEQGAEQLLGMGDMLYMAGGGRITRLHGPFVSDEEVEQIVSHLKSQGSPEYLESVTEEDSDDGPDGFDHNQSNTGDELYDKAVNIVLADRKASTSYIQRRLSIGYNRAATLIEKMEQEGVISPANHAGKREILVGDDPTV